MPRRSAASLGVFPIDPKRSRPRLAPSSDAPAEVAQVFGHIVRSMPADHFKVGDAPLIQGYAEAIVLARQAAVALASDGPVVAGRTSPWLVVQEKAHRALAALSMRLRMSPQHRADARSAGRRADQPPRSIYDIMREQDDAEGE
jgi:hypothetical protein